MSAVTLIPFDSLCALHPSSGWSLHGVRIYVTGLIDQHATGPLLLWLACFTCWNTKSAQSGSSHCNCMHYCLWFCSHASVEAQSGGLLAIGSICVLLKLVCRLGIGVPAHHKCDCVCLGDLVVACLDTVTKTEESSAGQRSLICSNCSPEYLATKIVEVADFPDSVVANTAIEHLLLGIQWKTQTAVLFPNCMEDYRTVIHRDCMRKAPSSLSPSSEVLKLWSFFERSSILGSQHLFSIWYFFHRAIKDKEYLNNDIG